MKGSVVVQAKEAPRSRQSLALLALPVIVMGPVESFVLASNRGRQQTAEAEDPARVQLQARLLHGNWSRCRQCHG